MKGVVCSPGDSLLISELNTQTNTPLPSVLLQNHVVVLSVHKRQL